MIVIFLLLLLFYLVKKVKIYKAVYYTGGKVADWLRRWDANPLECTRVGSYPIAIAILSPWKGLGPHHVYSTLIVNHGSYNQ